MITEQEDALQESVNNNELTPDTQNNINKNNEQISKFYNEQILW